MNDLILNNNNGNRNAIGVGLFLLSLALSLAWNGCHHETIDEPPDYRTATELALEWNNLALELERRTMGFRPPVSARMFAYVEMAAYEAALPALRDYVSLENFVSGYKQPVSTLGAGQFCLPISLNAAYAQILRDFFHSAPAKLHQQIDHLEQKNAQALSAKTEPAVAARSMAYGKAVAASVWAWSKTDQEGHGAHMYNYDHSYSPPTCQGCWQPAGEHSSPALLPYWGRVRPFVATPDEVLIKNPITYDEKPGSEFYTEAMEVFTVSKPLSKETRWIAEFWSDDHPGLTLTPVGRWISIANQALEKSRPPFPLVIETYLKTAWALHDAGVIVWEGKYRYNLERPDAYIRQQISPEWKSLHETPSFPAYPSGHAGFGAAAAAVLSDALGHRFGLTDRTHKNRPEFASEPRRYASFEEMAQENAASRLFLGVHYRMDCVEGLRLGRIVGQKTSNLPLRRKAVGVLIKQ